MAIERSGPAIIGFDDSPAAENALREAADLLDGRRALVVVVWEAGRSFDMATLPAATVGLPLTTLDIRGALEIDRTLYENAERLARRGAALANELGLKADGLAVADEVTVADTLLRVADENDAQAIVVGNPTRRALTEAIVGSTPRTLMRRATCPIVVVRLPDDRERRN